MEVFNWRNAIITSAPPATGSFLRVFKGVHQAQGLFSQYAHLTMPLKIQKVTGEFDHSSYGGAFHLYIEILDPVVGKTKKQLKPVALSYVNSQQMKQEHAIANAVVCDSDG